MNDTEKQECEQQCRDICKVLNDLSIERREQITLSLLQVMVQLRALGPEKYSNMGSSFNDIVMDMIDSHYNNIIQEVQTLALMSND